MLLLAIREPAREPNTTEGVSAERSLQRAHEVCCAGGELLARPDQPGRGYYSAIVGTERCQPGGRCDLARGIVTDAVTPTVTFHLRAPDADFLTKLALPWAAAVPARPARDGDHGVAATGPYMVAVYQKNRLLRLVRNPMFREWSADAQPDGYPDAITWKFVTPPNSLRELRAVEQRQSDIARAARTRTRPAPQ